MILHEYAEPPAGVNDRAHEKAGAGERRLGVPTGQIQTSLDEEPAPCGVTVAAGACDGLCADCAEWPKVCEQQRRSRPTGVGLLPCPTKFQGQDSCVGCMHLRAAGVSL
jgi:hypothetical protein